MTPVHRSSHPDALTYRYVAITDVGRRRSINQDSGFASNRLLVIADGMGGAAAGDLASAEAMNVVRRLDGPLEGDAVEALAGAVHRANDRLGEVIEADPAVEGMGTTLTALLWDGKKFGMAHIGDSRAYLLRGGQLRQITKDHTFVQSLVDEGRISLAEARQHPHRSLILRVLLGADDNEPDLTTVEPQAGDRYLLCSDGLSDMVDDAGITEALSSATIDAAAVDLVNRALDGGGADNITCVIAEMVRADAPVDSDLASSNGEPMLVGAASDQPRPPTGNATTSSTPVVEVDDSDLGPGTTVLQNDVDPEQLRYAPREPERLWWLKWIAILVIVVAILAMAGRWAYNWSQDQYFVAESGGRVTIYQGVQAKIPGMELEKVYEISDVDLTTLPTFRQQQVREGIEANNLTDARDSVKSLQELAQKCADPATATTPGSECEGAG